MSARPLDLDAIKERFKFVVDAWSEQRNREREDVRLQVAEHAWSAEAKEARKGRPMLHISLLAQPQKLVRNQAANASLGLNLRPVSETASKELAEAKQGLYRRIEKDGNANQARLWALARAIQCGIGWYRINYQWDEDGDDPLDQEIVYERVLYQESIYADPAATKPDFSDGEDLFAVSRMTEDAFRREFPDAKMSTNDYDFADAMASDPEWVGQEGDKHSVLVAEYFYKVHDYEEIEHRGQKRKRDKVSVRRALVTACEILEDEPWGGSEGIGSRYIPLVPVIGEELQPIDGKRRWEGMVRPARDGQEIFDYAISSIVEDVGRLSKAPYIVAAGQLEGYEAQWNRVNTSNQPYVEYKAIDAAGKPAPPPQPMQIDGTKMQLSIQLAELAKTLVQAATAIYEPSLGDDSKRKDKQSGRAILALQQQGDAGTSNYIHNLTTISMALDARIVLDLMPDTYDRPGRVTQVLGGEDEPQSVMLNAPFVKDANGRPVQAQKGQEGARELNLRDGKYSISTSAGKSFQTRLEQGATEMGEILEAAPELMPVVGDLYFKFRDFPGAKEISERLAKWREKQIPGLGDDKDGQVSPEQAQMKVQALEQQLQAMQQEMKQMAMALEVDKAKQEATIAKTQMDNQTKLQIAAMQTQTQAKDDAIKLALEKMQQQFEAFQNNLDRKLELTIHREEMAHDVALAAGGGKTMETTRDRGQEQERGREDERSQGQTRGSESSSESGYDQPQEGA